jgi:predicted HicB family RNase H-like nuclease
LQFAVKKKEMENLKTLTTRIDIDDYEALKKLAAKKYCSMNGIIRQLVHDYIEQHK